MKVDRKSKFIENIRTKMEKGQKLGNPLKMKQYMNIVETVLQIKHENENEGTPP